MKPLINKYNWMEIDCPLWKDNSKRFEKNNPVIAHKVLNVEK